LPVAPLLVVQKLFKNGQSYSILNRYDATMLAAPMMARICMFTKFDVYCTVLPHISHFLLATAPLISSGPDGSVKGEITNTLGFENLP
jgi:hypothetical protein